MALTTMATNANSTISETIVCIDWTPTGECMPSGTVGTAEDFRMSGQGRSLGERRSAQPGWGPRTPEVRSVLRPRVRNREVRSGQVREEGRLGFIRLDAIAAGGTGRQFELFLSRLDCRV